MAWYESIYKALIFGSAITFIISNLTTGANSYNSLITGYSILILGILMILTIMITKILDVQKSSSTMQIFLSIIMTLGPFLLMLGIIGFMLFLIIYYKTPILENQVSSSYGTFSNITLMLLLIQVYIVYTNIDTDEFKINCKISQLTSVVLYFLGVITIMYILTIYVILKYFRADGFQMLQNAKNIQFNYLL